MTLNNEFEEEKSQIEAQIAQIQHERKLFHEGLIQDKFTEIVAKAGAISIDDAIKLADLSSVTIDDDGKMTGMEEALSTLVADKPYLFAKKKQTAIGMATNGPPQSTARAKGQLLSDAAAKARKSGRTEDRAAYATLKRKLGL